MEVLILPGGPFILKLMPNNPSPTSLGIIMFPITGILEITLFKVFAGTNVPLKLTNFFDWLHYSNFVVYLDD